MTTQSLIKIFIFFFNSIILKSFEKKCEKINILWSMEKKTKPNQLIVLLRINPLIIHQKDSGKGHLRSNWGKIWSNDYRCNEKEVDL